MWKQRSTKPAGFGKLIFKLSFLIKCQTGVTILWIFASLSKYTSKHCFVREAQHQYRNQELDGSALPRAESSPGSPLNLPQLRTGQSRCSRNVGGQDARSRAHYSTSIAHFLYLFLLWWSWTWIQTSCVPGVYQLQDQAGLWQAPVTKPTELACSPPAWGCGLTPRQQCQERVGYMTAWEDGLVTLPSNELLSMLHVTGNGSCGTSALALGCWWRRKDSVPARIPNCCRLPPRAKHRSHSGCSNHDNWFLR